MPKNKLHLTHRDLLVVGINEDNHLCIPSQFSLVWVNPRASIIYEASGKTRRNRNSVEPKPSAENVADSFASKSSILCLSPPAESALAFGTSKPSHTSRLGLESGFAVVTYFLLSLLNSNDGDMIRPLCSVELPAIGAIAGRSVPMLRIRTLASQWIPLVSLGYDRTQGPSKATGGSCL